MEVRFILDSEDSGERVFDRTVELPAAPMPGETVGIDPESRVAPTGSAWLVEVSHRRWYINADEHGDVEPVLECWLTDSDGGRRNNLWVHSGCRWGFEQMMASRLERLSGPASR